MSKKLNIYLAGPRGFCAGVDRAIEMVKGALKKYGAPVYVRHEIVHNKFVVENLKSQGAIFIEELNEIVDKSRPVIFSAHGVPKGVPEEALSLNLVYYDATCPLVSKIHKEVENFDKKNLPVILIGHRNHPEVIGTMGQTDKKIYLVEKVEDIKKLPFNQNDEIAYVTQTTLSVDDTKDIIKEIKLHFSNVIEPKKNDICYATTNRQNAVKELTDKCDIIFVVGSENSSNSNRLKEIATRAGVPSYLLDSADDLDVKWLHNKKNIGLTAGASAPEILVQSIINKLMGFGAINVINSSGIEENITFKIPKELMAKS